MNKRIEKALLNKKNGYNCSQAVICAYCDLFGINEKQAFMISEGFGGGMGGMHETCGALSAIYMLAGLQNSSGNLEEPDSKAKTYRLIQQFAQNFKEKNSTTLCRELKGLTGKPMIRSCDGCIEDACTIFEEHLKCIKPSPANKL